MGKSGSKLKSEFHLEGRLLSVFLKDGYKVKGLRLATSSGEYKVKLPKDVRKSLIDDLTPGDWLCVSGQQKIDMKKGTVMLKAASVDRTTPGAIETVAPHRPDQISDQISDRMPHQADAKPSQEHAFQDAESKQTRKPETILVCKKSDCCKRGGKAVSQTLEKILSDRQLDDRVTIKQTGCMKRCKAGPNIVMPDKTRYSRVSPDEIPEIVDKHIQTLATHP
ncbi:MAG TPA: (2Fe-2S) ferredoxin domain-containing protein [Elainellaceae cyanobacterium]